jgi:hypothetical protein
MAYLFITDGAPEAEEYESNYLYFDESNPMVVSEIERLLAKRKDDPSVPNQLVELCNKSFQLKERLLKVSFPVKINIGSYLKKIRSTLNNLKRNSHPRLRSALSH